MEEFEKGRDGLAQWRVPELGINRSKNSKKGRREDAYMARPLKQLDLPFEFVLEQATIRDRMV